jgi:colicin import membrane protein
MSAAALPRPPAPPRRRSPDKHDTLPSFALALAMHALLFGSMAYVVRWKTQDPAPVVAELWVSSPQPVVEVPAPPPPPPPPPPKVEEPEPPKPNADIVTKDEKKPPPKVEPPKVEEKKPPPKKAEPKKDEIANLLKKQEEKSRAEREALRKAEADRIEKQMAEASAPTPQPGTGRASADYISRLTALIKSRIVYNVPEGTPTSVHAEVQVELLPSGEVVGVRFLKESGLPGYDAAVERAIRRTDPFPRKPDGTVDRTIVIRFNPVEPQT